LTTAIADFAGTTKSAFYKKFMVIDRRRVAMLKILWDIVVSVACRKSGIGTTDLQPHPGQAGIEYLRLKICGIASLCLFY